MRSRMSVLVALLLAASVSHAPSAQSRLTIPDVVSTQIASDGSALVIVGVATAFVPEGDLSGPDAIAAQREAMHQAVDGVMDRAAAAGAVVGTRFETIPFFTARVDGSALAALAAMPEVSTIEENGLAAPVLGQSAPLIAAPLAWAAGATGAGWTVAILDTGVEKTHSFLAGKVSSEACYSNAGGFGTGTSTCPGGAPASTATGSGVPCSATIDGCYHGTHVAGIAAGANGTGGINGIAPGAGLIAVQVFTRFDGATECGGAQFAPCVLTYSSDQILALERVLVLTGGPNNDNHVSSVNMSLGGGSPSTDCDAANPSRKAAIDNLRSRGVATVIASGNNSFTTGISTPACISTAVSVGSTTKLDAMSSFTNRGGGKPYLVAPGSSITASLTGNTFGTLSGTSMATPHVAGAWAVLKQAQPAATVTQVLSALQAAGVGINDPATSTVYRRINVNAARLQLLAGGFPIVANDAYAAAFNTTLVIPAPGVLANDNSNGGGAMTASLVTSVANGVLTLSTDGSFSYAPSTGFIGADSFTYRAVNTVGPSDIATVTITVSAPPPPTAANDTYSTPFDAPLIVSAPGVLGNDNSNGGGALSAILVSNVSHGALSLAANGGFTYAPSAGFAGSDTFSYRASNVQAQSNIATVAITVEPPIARPPTDLFTSSIVGDSVTLRWKAPTTGLTPTGYVLEGGVNPGEALASIPTGSAAPIFTFRAPTGAFYLRVRTATGAMSSVPSNEVRIFINVPAPPSTPANLLGLVNGSALGLSWTNTAAGGAPTTIILDVTGALTGSVPLSVSETFAVSGVPPGTYTFSVRAANAAGSSASTTPVTLTFPGACSGPPLTPVSFIMVKSGNTLTLAWLPPASGPAVTSYLLNVSGAFNGTVPTPARHLSASVGLGAYTVAVAATNACGTSAATPPQTVNVSSSR